jgi:hypothetical protein
VFSGYSGSCVVDGVREGKRAIMVGKKNGESFDINGTLQFKIAPNINKAGIKYTNLLFMGCLELDALCCEYLLLLVVIHWLHYMGWSN